MDNPYSGQGLIGFFGVFFHRLWEFVTGALSFEALATDEVQLLVLGCVAASGALVGTFLVLRRMVMLANALSHTILLGIVSAYLVLRLFASTADTSEPLSISVLLLAAFATGIVTTFLTEFLSKIVKLQEDASIGLVFSVLFALGIVLVTFFSRNLHMGVELVMGNADALQIGDVRDVVALLGINLALFTLFFHGFKITSFDPSLARAFGFSPLFFNYLLMVQTSATAIGGFRAVGVLMILAFFVIPTLTARMLTNRLSSLIGVSMGIGVLAALFGVGLARHILTYYGVGLSTGGLVVSMLGLIYLSVVVYTQIVRFSHRRKLINMN
ncbi:MAG: Manganese transport system membrane protein MntD [Chlamydiales bacterium]|nr:Manganese transport system membrane protein MntD [Chlamydiales bacterium]